jgi:hypothetical protein
MNSPEQARLSRIPTLTLQTPSNHSNLGSNNASTAADTRAIVPNNGITRSSYDGSTNSDERRSVIPTGNNSHVARGSGLPLPTRSPNGGQQLGHSISMHFAPLSRSTQNLRSLTPKMQSFKDVHQLVEDAATSEPPSRILSGASSPRPHTPSQDRKSSLLDAFGAWHPNPPSLSLLHKSLLHAGQDDVDEDDPEDASRSSRHLHASVSSSLNLSGGVQRVKNGIVVAVRLRPLRYLWYSGGTSYETTQVLVA